MPYIEQGERDFSFRFEVGAYDAMLNAAGRLSEHFNRPPMVLSFYPTGVGEKPAVPFTLAENDIVTVTAFKKAECGDGFIIRLFNPTDEPQRARVNLYGETLALTFGKYEIKTVRYDGKTLAEADLLEGLLDGAEVKS